MSQRFTRNLKNENYFKIVIYVLHVCMKMLLLGHIYILKNMPCKSHMSISTLYMYYQITSHNIYSSELSSNPGDLRSACIYI